MPTGLGLGLFASLAWGVVDVAAAISTRFVGSPTLGWTRPVVLVVIVAGACEIAAFAAYAIGLGVAPVWLIGLSSSFGPVLAVGYAVWRLGERPHRTQWAGLGLIAIGIGVLALAGS